VRARPITPTDPDTGLTRRQADVVRLITAHFREHHCWPSLREITALLGLATAHPNAAKHHLDVLQKKGVLVYDGGRRARSVRLAGLVW